MVASCSACKNRQKTGSQITFHRFPRDPEKRKRWLLHMKRKNFTPSDTSVLCSTHFEKECFILKGNTVLKPDAVPTIFKFPEYLSKKEKLRSTTNSDKLTASLALLDLAVPTTTTKPIVTTAVLDLPVPNTSSKPTVTTEVLDLPVPTTSNKATTSVAVLDLPVPTTSSKPIVTTEVLDLPVPTTSNKATTSVADLDLLVPLTSTKSTYTTTAVIKVNLAVPTTNTKPIFTTTVIEVTPSMPDTIMINHKNFDYVDVEHSYYGNAESLKRKFFGIFDHLEETKKKLRNAMDREKRSKTTIRALLKKIKLSESAAKMSCSFKGCTKEFSRPDKLKAHIKTHSGIKPFKCSTCEKAFKCKPHLLEHEHIHKADNYRYSCDKCGKGFFRPKLFSEHKCTLPKPGTASNIVRTQNSKKVVRPRKKVADSVPNTSENVSKLFLEHKCTPSKPGTESNIVRARNSKKIVHPRKKVPDNVPNAATKIYSARSTTVPRPIRPKPPQEDDTNMDMVLKQSYIINSNEIEILNSNEIEILNSNEIEILNSNEIEILNSNEIEILNSNEKKVTDNMPNIMNGLIPNFNNNIMEADTVILDSRKHGLLEHELGHDGLFEHEFGHGLIEHELGYEELIDHFVVHLADEGDGSAIQTISGVSDVQVITENGDIPSTIIEAQQVQINGHGFALS